MMSVIFFALALFSGIFSISHVQVATQEIVSRKEMLGSIRASSYFLFATLAFITCGMFSVSTHNYEMSIEYQKMHSEHMVTMLKIYSEDQKTHTETRIDHLQQIIDIYNK